MEKSILNESTILSFVFKENKYSFKKGANVADTKKLGEISIEFSEISLSQISNIVENYDYSEDILNIENFKRFIEYFFKELIKIQSYSVAFFIKNIALFYFIGYWDYKIEFIEIMKKNENINILEFCQNIKIFVLNTLLIDISNLQNLIKSFVNKNDTEPEVFINVFNELFQNNLFEYRIQALKNNEFIEIYSTSNPKLFLMFEFCNMIKSDVTIKSCSNCGKIFIPQKRSDTIYCERPSPQDNSMSCKEYGSKKLWYNKAKENKSTKLYRNIYTAKQMLSKINPDIQEYKEDFEKYKIDVKQWKKDVKEGRKTDEEFITWLKSVRGKRYLD